VVFGFLAFGALFFGFMMLLALKIDPADGFERMGEVLDCGRPGALGPAHDENIEPDRDALKKPFPGQETHCGVGDLPLFEEVH
jgi:hypothetical protein